MLRKRSAANNLLFNKINRSNMGYAGNKNMILKTMMLPTRIVASAKCSNWNSPCSDHQKPVQYCSYTDRQIHVQSDHQKQVKYFTQTHHQHPGKFDVMSSPPKSAYDGAKFDVDGYCLKHPKIRLSKLREKHTSFQRTGSDRSNATAETDSSEESFLQQQQRKYIIVRKVCPKCGEHSLRNERTLDNKIGWLHGRSRTEVLGRRNVNRNVRAIQRSDQEEADKHVIVHHSGAKGNKSNRQIKAATGRFLS